MAAVAPVPPVLIALADGEPKDAEFGIPGVARVGCRRRAGMDYIFEMMDYLVARETAPVP